MFECIIGTCVGLLAQLPSSPGDWGSFRALRDISVHQSWADVQRQIQCSEPSVGRCFAADLGLIVRRESAADTYVGFKNRICLYLSSKHHCCPTALHKQLGTRDWLADDKIPDLGAEDRELGLLVYMKSPAIFCWKILGALMAHWTFLRCVDVSM